MQRSVGLVNDNQASTVGIDRNLDAARCTVRADLQPPDFVGVGLMLALWSPQMDHAKTIFVNLGSADPLGRNRVR